MFLIVDGNFYVADLVISRVFPWLGMFYFLS
jgi:hypothetical protein